MVFRVALQSVVWACSWHLKAAVRRRRRTASTGRRSRAIRAAPGRARPHGSPEPRPRQRPSGRPRQRRGPGAWRRRPAPCPRLLPGWEAGPRRLQRAPAGRQCAGGDQGAAHAPTWAGRGPCAPAPSVVRLRRGGGGSAERPLCPPPPRGGRGAPLRPARLALVSTTLGVGCTN